MYREETWHFTETSSHSNTSEWELNLGIQHQLQEDEFESSNFCPQSDWKNNEIAAVQLHSMYNSRCLSYALYGRSTHSPADSSIVLYMNTYSSTPSVPNLTIQSRSYLETFWHSSKTSCHSSKTEKAFHACVTLNTGEQVWIFTNQFFRQQNWGLALFW